MGDPVEQQLEAFNARDLDAFLEAYAAETRIEDGRGEAILSGRPEMRAFYGDLFENSPELHCEVVNKVAVGNWVLHEEQLQGLQAEGFPEEAHAAVAYQVEEGRITFVRMFM